MHIQHSRKYAKGGRGTWAYAALYCCIWLAPGIIADTPSDLFDVLSATRRCGKLKNESEKELLVYKGSANFSHNSMLSSFRTFMHPFKMNPECKIHLNHVFFPSAVQQNNVWSFCQKHLCFLFTVSAWCWSEKRKRESVKVRMRYFQGGILRSHCSPPELDIS